MYHNHRSTYHRDVRDNEREAEARVKNLAGGRLPSDAAVRSATVKYIRDDFRKNGHKYAPDDVTRVLGYLSAHG